MTKKFALRWLLFGILVILVVGLIYNRPALANLSVSETALKPAGAAYEINPDNSGVLWVTDYLGGEIRGINPATNEYDAFPVGGLPADGRQVGGWLWWVNEEDNKPYIGRVSTSSSDYKHWEIPSISYLFSSALDSLGRLFAVDINSPTLYRLDPNTEDPNLAELCTYILPVMAGSPERDWMVVAMISVMVLLANAIFSPLR